MDDAARDQWGDALVGTKDKALLYADGGMGKGHNRQARSCYKHPAEKESCFFQISRSETVPANLSPNNKHGNGCLPLLPPIHTHVVNHYFG